MTTYVPKTRPYKHQQLALDQSWREPFYGYLMEMGTGKSKVCIDNMCMLREQGEIDCVLIVAPKGTYSNWVHKEIPAHMPDRHRVATRVHMWRGGHREEERSLSLIVQKSSTIMRVLVMNTEALSASTKAQNFAEKFLRSGRCMMIVDESSTIKNPQATRTKKMIKLGRLACYRRIATGTPVTRSPLDLWAQFEFLQPGYLGFRSFHAFRARFAVLETKHLGGRSIDVPVAYRDVEVLARMVATKAIVLKKVDCLDLPPKVYVTHRVTMTEEQRQLYNDMADWSTAQLDAGAFTTASHTIVQLLRLHQICCGHTVSETGQIYDIPMQRVRDLREILEGVEGRVIVWCGYRVTLDKIAAMLDDAGLRYVLYHGGVPQAERAEAIYRFQGVGSVVQNGQVVGERVCPEEDRADVFLGTPGAGGYGITLTAANTVIYFCDTHNLEHRLQSEDRPHRIGQTQTVTYIDMTTESPVELAITESNSRKMTLASMVMDGPARVRTMFSRLSGT